MSTPDEGIRDASERNYGDLAPRWQTDRRLHGLLNDRYPRRALIDVEKKALWQPGHGYLASPDFMLLEAQGTPCVPQLLVFGHEGICSWTFRFKSDGRFKSFSRKDSNRVPAAES